jgi:hypothetical protein
VTTRNVLKAEISARTNYAGNMEEHYVQLGSNRHSRCCYSLAYSERNAFFWLARDVENYKAKLKATSQVEIETLKAQLQISHSEHSIRFDKLHEKRVDILAKVYGYLSQAITNLRSCAGCSKIKWIPDSLPFRHHEDAKANLKAAKDAYLFNEIYLNEVLCCQLDKLFLALDKPSHVLVLFPQEWQKHCAEKFLDQWGEVEPMLENAMKSLKCEFRRILGSQDADMHGSFEEQNEKLS